MSWWSILWAIYRIKSFIDGHTVWVHVGNRLADFTSIRINRPELPYGFIWKNTSINSLTVCVNQSRVHRPRRFRDCNSLGPVVQVVVDVVADHLVDVGLGEVHLVVDGLLDHIVLKDVPQLPVQRLRVEVLKHRAVVVDRGDLPVGEADQVADTVDDLLRGQSLLRRVHDDGVD